MDNSKTCHYFKIETDPIKIANILLIYVKNALAA